MKKAKKNLLPPLPLRGADTPTKQHGFDLTEQVTQRGEREREMSEGHGGDDREVLLDEESGFEEGPQRREEEGGDGGGGGRKKLGTFLGVFCPVSVSMFSTLLFLRVGFIVGNLGLVGSFVALLLAYVLLSLTVQSLSAIVTNGDVRGGGVYFMLSRCLGPEIGGTIGMVFYAANMVGSALYATGCAEGLIALCGGLVWKVFGEDARLYHYFLASMSNLISLLICLLGADIFGALSAFVLAGVLSILGELTYNCWASPEWVVHTYNVTAVPHCRDNCTYQVVNGTFQSIYYLGVDGVRQNLADNFYSDAVYDCEDPSVPVSAKTAFAVLFAGVTGIMAGANLSGELRAPSKSIPWGTYLGSAFTFCVYLAMFVMTAATCTRNLLYHECHYLSVFSTPPWLVALGAFVTTFCAATSGMLGASQLLQAVAKDNILPKFLSFPLKWGVFRGRPVVAYLITFLLVQVVLTVKSLNQIARLCTICYLLSYGFVNLACVLLDWSAAINFRPTMGTHWTVGLIAVILSVGAMASVSLLYSLIGFFVTLGFGVCVVFGTRHGEKKNWGSVQQGILYHQVRKYLLMLDTRKYHVKFWRPQILLLVRDPRASRSAISFGNNLKKGGLFIIGHIFKGDVNNLRDGEVCPTVKGPKDWMDFIDSLDVKAFADLTVAPTLRAGVQQLARLAGIGAMKPNIVMMGFKGRIAEDAAAAASEGHDRPVRREAGTANDGRKVEAGAESFPDPEEESGDSLSKPSPVDKVQVEDSVPVQRQEVQGAAAGNVLRRRSPMEVAKEEDQSCNDGTPPPPIPWNHEGFSVVSDTEYCNILRDMTRLGKSLVLHRNVAEMDPSTWTRRNCLGCRVIREEKTLDVWLVDFLSPPNTVVDDFGCMLLLQLAFIASGKLGGLPVRVFLRSSGDTHQDEEVVENFKT